MHLRHSILVVVLIVLPLLSGCALFGGKGKSTKTLAEGYWSGTGTDTGLNATVWGLGMYNGSLLAGGDLTHAGATPVGRCARWRDGEWHAMGSGISGNDASHFCVLGEYLYVGGNFTSAGGIATKNLARWDGAAWSAFGNNHFGGPVDDLFVHQGALHVLARTSDSVSSGAILSRWNGAGWDDIGAFNAWAAHGRSEGNVLYVVGRFHNVSGVVAHGVARWADGTWSAMGPGLGATGEYLEVNHLLRYQGDLIAVGEIYRTGDGLTTINGIARWTGTTWEQFAGGLTGGVKIRTAAVFGKELIIGGHFSAVGGVAVSSIAWWDGTTWHPFGTGTHGEAATCLLADRDGFWVGGGFSTMDGMATKMLARWNAGEPPMPVADN